VAGHGVARGQRKRRPVLGRPFERGVLELGVERDHVLEVRVRDVHPHDPRGELGRHGHVREERAELLLRGAPVLQLEVHDEGLVLEVPDLFRDPSQVGLEPQEHLLHPRQDAVARLHEEEEVSEVSESRGSVV